MHQINCAIYGAFDRFNYGDLLFPILMRRLLDEHGAEDIGLDAYGMAESDLSEQGGVRTMGIKVLQQRSNYRAVIVAGGEVLGAGWAALHDWIGTSNPTADRVLRRVFSKEVRSQILRLFCYRSTLRFPFAVSPRDFPGQPLTIYNAVGASGFAALPRRVQKVFVDSLAQASYISVRDEVTRDALMDASDNSLRIELVPDSAVVMSRYFPKSVLLSSMRREYQDLVARSCNGYVVFQIRSEHLDASSREAIVSELGKVFERDRKPIVLLPISLARNHDDRKPLEILSAQLGNRATRVHDPNVLEIMSFIAHSSAFVGTSLHGIVTALSFGVPYVALCERSAKLSRFLKTWFPEEERSLVLFGEVARGCRDAWAISEEERLRKRDKLIGRYLASFAEVMRRVQGRN